ncbi:MULTISPECIES: ATP-dependent helicase [unclassified Bacillus (in: firmicutes)]|uniref:ATP-dependent helicase n=1 Tax=unclassified Bacillus (in: firmicutes) TaxID=185979 RepID=UPI0008EBF287|nr:MULTISPECIES: ATP-dependent helicase [unclassified Bacillus (in: firmicutes)]SFA78251.1 DNA helicase-2 / ATP-dependent DNA helicase PcrA [Bacillus sp. UNCCL13]SFQ68198.1 DNA helicase-2 / ATP-dependent DNA helicase PcrA [Bacillus sp. cl95]
MKTVFYQNRVIHIDQLDRSEFQKIYQSGKNGELACPVCHKKVKFYLGISQEPHFYHLQMESSACRDSEINSDKEPSATETVYIERNGFRMPQSRGIATLQKEDATTFKPARALTIHREFTPPSVREVTKGTYYLDNLLSEGVNLDKSQAKAVIETQGSLLVLAGAGSGKTRVLTARTAYMLEAEKIDPKTMMLLTFTSKAAAEMKNRMLYYPNMKREKVSQLVSGTFHSIFYRILLFHSPEKWSSEKLLKREWEKDRIVKEAGKELDLSEKDFAFDLALQQIGFWKNSLVNPKDVKPTSEWEEKVSFLYNRYEEIKLKEGLFDFDDMLLGCFALFQSSPSLLEKYQNRFQYFLVDEFQDINKVQYELVKLFSSVNKNVCAVGDDDQSIYSFRGSDPAYLLEFEKDFPDAKVIHLSQNYRSSHEIVTTANQIIVANKQRRVKKMSAQFTGTDAPTLFYPYDEEEEATMIVTDLQEKIAQGANPSDFAILYRTHSAARAIFERLANSSLPFKLDQDAESFYDRRTVKSLLAFMRLSLNEDDQNALPYIIGPLFLKQSVLKEVKAQSILQDCSFLETFTHIKTGHSFQERKLRQTASVVRSLKHLTPLSALEVIEKDLGFQDYLKKRGSEGNKMERSSDDLKDLKVAARNFTTLREFIDHTEHMAAMNKEMKKLSKTMENAITLSTIHRSKGLEYNTVYILGAVDGSLPHDYALESLRNGETSAIEEERRLLYVAVTRAKEKLYISVPEKRRGKNAAVSRFLKIFRS